MVRGEGKYTALSILAVTDTEGPVIYQLAALMRKDRNSVKLTDPAPEVKRCQRVTLMAFTRDSLSLY